MTLEEEVPARRRRGAELETALLDAAWEELVEVGYGALTFEAVATRAGTSRTVVYRRWSTKAELAEAAIVQVGGRHQMEPPDTGSLREDMLAMLRFVNERRLGMTALMVVFMGGYFQETGSTPADLRRLIISGGSTPVVDIVIDRAIERGEVSVERMTPLVRTIAVDLLRHDALMTLARVSDERLVEIVDEVFLPLATGSVTSRS